HAEGLVEDVLHARDDAAFLGVGPPAVGQRVVAGQLGHSSAADDVEAAVAHVAVGEVRVVGGHEGGDHGGAHPRVLVLGGGPREDGAVRELDRGPDAGGVEGQAAGGYRGAR